jgi:ParB family transcriptional regulator, chromosome partitioning protein
MPRPSSAATSRRQSSARSRPAQKRYRLEDIAIDQIDLPRQPARRFLGDIATLAESMQDYGLQQPISVRAQGKRFVLTSGMRRLAAAKMLKWATISAFVRSVSADDAYVIDLIENLQREDLSAEEEADAFGELIRTRGWTLHQVAEAVKRSVGYISKRVRVFEDPDLRAAIASRGLLVSTAEELLASEPAARNVLIERALADHWDQVQAREALRMQDTAHQEIDLAEAGHESRPRGRPSQAVVGAATARPKGLTAAIRQFHRLVLNLQAEELTQADRSALRSLFRDLVMLARAPSQRGARVFPPLPAHATKQSKAVARGRQSRRRA